MKTILVGVLIVIFGAVIFMVLGKPKPAVETAVNAPSVSTKYLEHNQSVLTKTAGYRRVLFFYASWCPTCRPADADFRTNEAKIPEDVRIIRVNYNDPQTDAEETALAKQYQITYQHTFVQIDVNGQPVTRWNGGSLAELLKNIKP
jgi:thiol-disulfide isomerase/thioredoxin